MKTILGKTILELQYERMEASKLLGKIVIATSTNPADDEIEELCLKKGMAVYRGHEDDVLDRHYQCAKFYGADVVAKIPSDCPLIDPQVIDKVFEYYFDNQYDYVSNLHPASYPDGNDVEVFSFAALENAANLASKKLEREHTTPYFWENPQLFKIGNVLWERPLDLSMSHRFTLDYPEDLLFIRQVFEELYPVKKLFLLNDILNLLDKKPDIYQINAGYAGVNWYRHHLDELSTISSSQTKQIK
jgi:spore coat polysaccharide biosynthesis protein SpsF